MKKPNILVWDLPTRAFHWLLALSFVGAYATADSERLRDVHVILGYTMLGLVAFRLLWGVIGTRYARFSSFTFGPRSVLAYLKSLLTRTPQHHIGHNPAGSWGIYALLTLTVLAGATGYATYTDIGGGSMEDAHEAASNALLAVVLIHVAGVLVSSFIHRENLVRSMLSGYKSGQPGDGIRHKHRIVAGVLLLAVAGYWVAGPESFKLPWNAPSQAATARGHVAHQDRD
jgi:cytochrome b